MHHSHHHKGPKLTALLKDLAADLKQTLKDVGQHPAYKALQAELRHTQADLKEAAADIQAAVKDAVKDIKAALKSADDQVQTSVEKIEATAKTELKDVHDAPTEATATQTPVRIVCDRARPAEDEADPIDATLIGLQTVDTMLVPVHG